MLLKYAYENVPYYAQLFRENNLKPTDIRTVKDIKKLPILSRTTIGSLPQQFMSNISGREIIPMRTNGTTATPLKFYRTKEDISWGESAWLRAYSWGSCGFGDKYVEFPAFQTDDERMSTLFRLKSIIERRKILLNIHDLSEESLISSLYKIISIKPQFVIGYSSWIYLLTKYLLREGISPPILKAIFASAETLMTYQKRAIENAFACQVYDAYAAREFSLIASECGEHSGHHVQAENVLIEFVKDGEEVAPGETGAMLITNLHNYAMPFIRYHIGDTGKPSDEVCSCGRGLPLIQSLEGRTRGEFIRTSDGSLVSLKDLDTVFENVPVKMFQIVQVDYDRIVVKIIKDEGYSEKDTNMIVKNIAYGSPKLKVDVEIVESIPATRSGKRNYIVSKMPIHEWMD